MKPLYAFFLTFIVALLLAGCASNSGKPWSAATARFDSQAGPRLMLAPGENAACEEIGRKRVVKVVYLWPLNPLKADDLRQSEKPARRFRTEITAGDIGFSLLGFLVGVVTETAVAEACDSPFLVMDAAEITRLRSIEQKSLVVASSVEESPKERAASTGEFPTLLVDIGQSRSAFSVYFPFGSAQLVPGEDKRLAAIAAELKAEGAQKILLIGHADRVGQEPYNDQLSRSRARTVQAALTRAGLDAQRLYPVAAGANWPRLATGAVTGASKSSSCAKRNDRENASLRAAACPFRFVSAGLRFRAFRARHVQ